MENINNWYSVANIDNIDTPALLVYPERIQENINKAKSKVAGVEWLRPHVKTHKMAEVASLMLNAGITKFKCATIAEAEMLGRAGAPDVLLAYQPVGPKISRLLQLVQTYRATTFACLLDNKASAEAISQIFAVAGETISVYLDLNVGMNRTGIQPGPEALELYRMASNLAGVKPVGLHTYDGHLRDADYLLRKEKSDLAFAAVTALAAKIEAHGMPKPILVAGGSPTFPVHAQRQGVESSLGTFIFWDWGYHVLLAEQDFLFAALVATRVISKLDDNTLCLDLGHKAIAAENPFPRVKFLNAPDAEAISQSEEHLVVRVASGNNYAVGDLFYGVPLHICPTCALYDWAHVIENNLATDTWHVVSRTRAITI